MTYAEKDLALGQDIKNRVIDHLLQSPDIDINMLRKTFRLQHTEDCYDELDLVISLALNDIREYQLDLEANWNHVWNIIGWAFQIEWDETIENWVKNVSSWLVDVNGDKTPKKTPFQKKLKVALMSFASLACVSTSGVAFVIGPSWLGIILIMIGTVSSVYTIPLFSKTFVLSLIPKNKLNLLLNSRTTVNI